MARKKRRHKSRVRLGLFLLIMIAILAGALVGAVAGFLGSAPTLAEVSFNPKLTTYVYDHQGRVLARLYTENRDAVKLSDVPIFLRQAVLAVEDDRFYRHPGIDLRSMARALLVNLRAGGVRQGGSTITQQLAKITFLSQERTVERKLRELLWAIQIERRYTKDEILEAYLNQVCLGHGTYGLEAGAQKYFGKSVRDVNLQEAAFLAGVINGPAIFSPFVDKEAAVRRRNFVLDRMETLGIVTSAEAEAARQGPVKTVALQPNQHQAPYFVDHVLQQLLDMYGEQAVYGGGLRVYTTLNLETQKAAEKALLSGLPRIEVDRHGLQQPQGAVLALDPATGAVRAMVGGRGTDKFNRATQAYRQPGSAFKPIVYAAALERGLTPATLIRDERITLTGNDGAKWSPENNDHTYRGLVTVREALEQSINTVAVKLVQQTSPRVVIEYGRRLGITSLVEKGPKTDLNAALALGGLTKGVSPLELTAAYVPFANGGTYFSPYSISKVTDSNGRVLYEHRSDRRTVMSEALAYLMTDLLQGVILRGTGRRADIGRPAAGKTGTSSEYTNAWFAGYTPDLVATVWIGNDAQKDPMTWSGGAVGSATAAEIWRSFMRTALAGQPPKSFRAPNSGLVGPLRIDQTNGLLVPDNCSVPPTATRQEFFLEGSDPTSISPACR